MRKFRFMNMLCLNDVLPVCPEACFFLALLRQAQRQLAKQGGGDMPWVHPADKGALLTKYAGTLEEQTEDEQRAAAVVAAAQAASVGPAAARPGTAPGALPGGQRQQGGSSAPKKLTVVAAMTALLGHLRTGDVPAALSVALQFDHALTPKKAVQVAESAAAVYPLAVALRQTGQTELAFRYVQRYGLHACPVCSLAQEFPALGATTAAAAGGCVGGSGCRSLPLHQLVADLIAAGNFDAVLRLQADARLGKPPHALDHHYSPPLLLEQALAQPRFAFVQGVQSSQQRWDLAQHVPLLRRWILEEIDQMGYGGGFGKGAASPMLGMAVSALVDGVQCDPPATAAAIGLQLGSVSSSTASLSLPPQHRVPALFKTLMTAGELKPALELLRKWFPGPAMLGVGAKRPKQQRPTGSIVWSAEEFGIGPATVIQQLLRAASEPQADIGGNPLVAAMSCVEHISHFGLQSEFPQVLSTLLAADKIDAAVQFSKGETPECIAAQATTLRHVASNHPLPSGSWDKSCENEDGTVGVGGRAALLAVVFNPSKKASKPIEEHAWTLRDMKPASMAELKCSITVVDSEESLGKAEAALKPLLKQAARAVEARTKVLAKVAAAGVSHVSQGEFVWESPTMCGYPLLGLDTESPPVFQRGAPTPAVSWLQVSGLRESFLFDLPALNADLELLVSLTHNDLSHHRRLL